MFNCVYDDENCDKSKKIKVKTVSTAAAEDKYVYSVSAGKIIGEGENVEWDLTEVIPGTYTISVGINSFYPDSGWQIYGQTMTRIVTIQ